MHITGGCYFLNARGKRVWVAEIKDECGKRAHVKVVGWEKRVYCDCSQYKSGQICAHIEHLMPRLGWLDDEEQGYVKRQVPMYDPVLDEYGKKMQERRASSCQ